jgi:hypothetical protein
MHSNRIPDNRPGYFINVHSAALPNPRICSSAVKIRSSDGQSNSGTSHNKNITAEGAEG